eukprot:1493626-Rhodomonas_salina.1
MEPALRNQMQATPVSVRIEPGMRVLGIDFAACAACPCSLRGLQSTVLSLCCAIKYKQTHSWYNLFSGTNYKGCVLLYLTSGASSYARSDCPVPSYAACYGLSTVLALTGQRASTASAYLAPASPLCFCVPQPETLSLNLSRDNLLSRYEWKFLLARRVCFGSVS